MKILVIGKGGRAYYREIVDYIQSHGVSISLAAVGKYAKNLMSTLDALRLSQENFRAIMEETVQIRSVRSRRRSTAPLTIIRFSPSIR